MVRVGSNPTLGALKELDSLHVKHLKQEGRMKAWTSIKEVKILSLKRKFKENLPELLSILEKFEYDLRLDNYLAGKIEKYWSFFKLFIKNWR